MLRENKNIPGRKPDGRCPLYSIPWDGIKIACKVYWDKYLFPTDSHNPHQYSSCTEFSRKASPMQEKLIECLNGGGLLGVYVLTYFLHHPSAHIAGFPGARMTVADTRKIHANLRDGLHLELIHGFLSLGHVDAVVRFCVLLSCFINSGRTVVYYYGNGDKSVYILRPFIAYRGVVRSLSELVGRVYSCCLKGLNFFPPVFGGISFWTEGAFRNWL